MSKFGMVTPRVSIWIQLGSKSAKPAILGLFTAFNGDTLAQSTRTCTPVRDASQGLRIVSSSVVNLSFCSSCSSDYKGAGVDQLANVINTIKTNPNDRRIIMSAWNPAGFFFFFLASYFLGNFLKISECYRSKTHGPSAVSHVLSILCGEW